MKIAVAQTRAVKGDIPANIKKHLKLIDLAIAHSVSFLVFPELSLTGYEPELAKELATDKTDGRFDVFQRVCNENNITVGAGAPTKGDSGTYITMLIFQPNQPRQTYSKKYLHQDEEPFFIPGDGPAVLSLNNVKIALAICYELSVPAHAELAFANSAAVYIASVAKSAAGVEKAEKSLTDIAVKYSMNVLMSNSIGFSDNFEGGGKSSAWSDKGMMLAQLADTEEGVVIMDTLTHETMQIVLK